MNDLSSLEPGQLAAATRTPLPRKRLGRGVTVLLAIMRIYVLVAIPIVAYAFVHALRAG
jgi:hypothetical protein